MKNKLQKGSEWLTRNPGASGFLMAFGLLLLAGGVLLLGIPHGAEVLFINNYSQIGLDRPVDWITRLGLGSTAAILAAILALYKLRQGLMMFFSLTLCGIVSVVCKNVLFAGIPRPLAYFEPEAFHRMLLLSDYNLMNSFPSGHSMTIFAVAFLLAYFAGKRWLGWLLAAFAVVVGLTRIYLCQHFLIDVYFGAVLGVACSLVTVWLADRVLKLNVRPFFELPVLFIRFKRILTSFFW